MLAWCDWQMFLDILVQFGKVQGYLLHSKFIFNRAELFVCWYFIKNLDGRDSFARINKMADRISVLAPGESDRLSLSLLSSATSYQAELLRSLHITFPKPVLEYLISLKTSWNSKSISQVFLGNLVTNRKSSEKILCLLWKFSRFTGTLLIWRLRGLNDEFNQLRHKYSGLD